MTITSRLTERRAVLEMMGDLVADDFSLLHHRLVDALRNRRTDIVLDFRGVDHVDYRDAPRLATELKLIRSHDADLTLVGLSPYLKDLLALAGLNGLLEAHVYDPGAVTGPAPARTPHAS
jgi:anti-anti-sigma factor